MACVFILIYLKVLFYLSGAYEPLNKLPPKK